MSRANSFFPIAARGIHDRGISTWAFIATFLLFAVGITLMVQDFATSIWGFDELPINQSLPATRYAIAAMPILGQMVVLYIGIGIGYSSGTNGYLLYVVPAYLIFWFIDVVPDILYWSADGNPLWVAVPLTIIVFTFGVEFIVTFTVGIMGALFLPYIWPNISRKFSMQTTSAPAQQTRARTSNRSSRNAP